MKSLDELQSYLCEHDFGPPCSQDDIATAESVLGQRLPKVLRDLYLAFNGFKLPYQESSAYFWPLFADGPMYGLVKMNQFFRQGYEFPRKFVLQCLFYGDDGVGGFWGITRNLPNSIIYWNASWGADFEIAGDDPIEVWIAAARMYPGGRAV
jgi:hypothetical protein